MLLRALEKVGMRDFVEQHGGLDGLMVKTEGGELSFGQRQLLCV